MADARLRDTLIGDPKMENLTDTEFRVWTLGLVYANRHLTDGHIPARALRYLHPDGEKPVAVERLLALKLWVHHRDGGWQIHDYLKSQSSAKQVTDYLEGNRRRQKEWRERQKAENASPDTSPNASSDTSLSRQGKARPGPAVVEGLDSGSEVGPRSVRENDAAMNRLREVGGL